jgi:oxazoline/thiazoline synthase
MMLTKPKLKSGVRVEMVPPDEVFLLREQESLVENLPSAIALKGTIYQSIFPLLNGNYTTDEISDCLQDRISSAEIYYALMLLTQQGYLVEGEDSQMSQSIESICQGLKIDSQQADRGLKTTTVAVNNLTDLDLSDFFATLASLQIKVVETAQPVDLKIIITDNYLAKSLEQIDRYALENSEPWLLINPLGINPWIGPLFVPGKTACWHCLKQRLTINSPIESYIQRHCPAKVPFSAPLTFLPTSVNIALNIAATEIFKWVTGDRQLGIEGTLIRYNARSTAIDKHAVIKRPQCQSCGERDFIDRQPQPIKLEHRLKTSIDDGGYRICSPAETLKQHAHQISPITGIVRGISKIPVAGSDLNHTYVAKHHFAPNFDDLDSLHLNIVGRSAGKGKTESQAQASAVCEAIERYSGSFDGDEIRHKHSYRSLGELAIHPNRCMQFSSTQYQQRHSWNQDCTGWFQQVPAPFDEESIVEWTPVWSLTDRTFKYLPTAYCYHGYPQTAPPMCWADSNGCASGNTLEEAILQGFMEVVERDCVAIWWYNRLQRPQVDLSSFDDPYFPALKAEYSSLNRDLWVLDITNDLGIPTFVAITCRLDRAVEDIVLGFGTHFDPTVAIGRALTEVNQILPNVLVVNADGTTKYPQAYNPLAIEWWQTATRADRPYLCPDERSPPRKKSDYVERWHDDIFADILTCQQIVENLGMEFLVLDQTRPDAGLKVAKTIIPGMRHIWKRLAPGRLYEVPVKLGWLEQPHQESQLNPFPMWM